MYQKVLLGGAFGVLSTIVYRFCFGKLNIFATNGNDRGEESIDFQVFRGKKGKFVTKKNLEKSAHSEEKLIQARATERSQHPAASSIVLTRNQEVIQTILFIHYFTHILSYNSQHTIIFVVFICR